MKYLLAHANRAILAGHLAANVALVFDFDGTLAPIVSDPEAAAMRAETRTLLRALSCRFPCAVISGRARDDVAPRLAGTGIACVVGNHGAEWGGEPLDGERLEPLQSQREIDTLLRLAAAARSNSAGVAP